MKSKYNPDNIKTLEHYVDLQAREMGYDLEANLALLKLYQFNPTHTNMAVVVQILLKSDHPSPHRLCALQMPRVPGGAGGPPDQDHPLPGGHAGDVSVQFKIIWQQVQSQGELINKYVQEFEDS